MRFVIVTGMSGAGKTTALKMLEDMGYFCVDNLPIAMFPGFVQMIENSETPMKKVALGVDVRSGQDISGLEKDLEQMDQKGIKYEILFLDAKDSVLVKRYKETRRQHPLSGSGRVDTGIAKEREKTAFLKMKATYILDTSKMLTRELKIELDSEDYDSLGGLIIEHLDRLPQMGDEVVTEDGIRLVVEKLDKNRVETVHVYLPERTDTEEADGETSDSSETDKHSHE